MKFKRVGIHKLEDLFSDDKVSEFQEIAEVLNLRTCNERLYNHNSNIFLQHETKQHTWENKCVNCNTWHSYHT